MLGAFWLSLKQASNLVSDAVLAVRDKIDAVDTTSPIWETEVVPETLKLIQETQPILTEGWETALFGFWLGLWAGALSNYCKILDRGATGVRSSSRVNAFFPLLVCIDVAQATSDCDNITDSLNAKRIKSGIHLRGHAEIEVLETALRNTN